MTASQLAIALAAATAAPLAWRWRGAVRAWGWQERLAGCLLLAAVITFWLLVVSVVIGTLSSDWNGARLAPTFALVYGYRLYYPATEGPILDHLYGPVAALAFLPATIFRLPTPAILAGGLLQVCFVFGALLAFVWRAGGREAASRPLALACGLGASLLLARYSGTSYWITMVHADGPSLALGLLACTALVWRVGAPPTTRALLASATAAVLSCWAKQTAAPLPVALALALWLAHGRALAARYVITVVGIGAVFSAAFLYWFGEPLLFNMVEVASRHPWFRPGIAGLAKTVWYLLGSIWEILLLLAVGLAVTLLTRGERVPRAAQPWVAPLLAAVFLLPTGALGANKLGGQPNSFHSVYYLIAAVAAMFAGTGGRAPAARVLGWAFCAIGILAAWESGRCRPWEPRPPLWQNSNQLAYEFAARHPGEAYFPWQPLASLLAEGRLYHFEFGMADRYFGGYEPSPAHVRAHVPPRLRWIAAQARSWTSTFFPEFSEETRLPQLPGWVVRTRPPP